VSSRASLLGELLLLVGLLAVAYLLYVQQEQLASVELELDRLRGAFAAPPVPVADNGAEAQARTPAARPKPKRKAAGGEA